MVRRVVYVLLALLGALLIVLIAGCLFFASGTDEPGSRTDILQPR